MPGTMTAPPASITSAFDRSISSFAPIASMRPSAMATLTARRSESDEPSARAASCRIVRRTCRRPRLARRGSPQLGPRFALLLADRTDRRHAGSAHELVEGRHIGLRDRSPLHKLRLGALRKIVEDVIHRLRRGEVRAPHGHGEAADLQIELGRVVQRVLAALRLYLDEL